MLIDLKYLIKKYNLNIRGIIQVGSHWAEEYECFKDEGINFFVFIEPCKAAFEVIRKKIEPINLDKTNSTFISCFNRAISNYEGTAIMNIETKNNGQSNSLLKPKKHLESYPDIVFNGEEEVKVSTLDSLDFDIFGRGQTNMLVMDTQGTELSVLKGGIETLQFIDYIYTEINTDDVYENCCRVEEMDEFLILFGFKRVETKMTSQGWGDAFYIKSN